jgi:hypothetical protein
VLRRSGGTYRSRCDFAHTIIAPLWIVRQARATMLP